MLSCSCGENMKVRKAINLNELILLEKVRMIYNEKYDAYNGDYLYDAYNNALIIFDNNIKVTPVDAPLNWKMNNGIQQFINEEGTVYTEQDGDYSKIATFAIIMRIFDNDDFRCNPWIKITNKKYIKMSKKMLNKKYLNDILIL